MYDMSLKHAMSMLNCLPLSLTETKSKTNRICSPWDQIRFFEIVRSKVSDFKGKCPTACNKNIYTLEIVKRLPIEDTDYYPAFTFMGRDALPFAYLYSNNMSSYSENIQPDISQLDTEGPFLRRMKRMAGLHITFKHTVYAKVIKDIRVATQDKVAIIGGILGLFTGFSIVSLVEGAYWLYLACAQRFSRLKRKITASQIIP